jgi:catechol 2,3-dioxygenase-like lactoylglutathione lyase family enzyme
MAAMKRELSRALWGAQLDHLLFGCQEPERMAAFYATVLGTGYLEDEDGAFIIAGPGRKLLVRKADAFDQLGAAFRFSSAGALDRYRAAVAATGLNLKPLDTPFFRDGFAVTDPDGRDTIFGLVDDDLALPEPVETTPPGRLQHAVVATTALPEMIDFYENRLGFLPSDYVIDDKVAEKPVTAAFYRSDPEHHSVAVFRADSARPDHHAYEVECWNDIRDWADRLAEKDIRIWWGPGRHGVGNNLFFMIEDPWGYKLEMSAELESVPAEVEVRTWAHGPRALNLWGNAWMRS